MRTTPATAAVAAMLRTSQLVTITARSADSRIGTDAAVSCLGRSHTTVVPPRRPASTIDAAAVASISWNSLVPESTLRPRNRGNTSRTALQPSRPLPTERSGQRKPGTDSTPSIRSSPPPQGSRSTSNASSALHASAPAKTDAPPPPRPAVTAITRPRRRATRPSSAASDSQRTSSASWAGRTQTHRAPTAMAAAHVAAEGSAAPSRNTSSRRGIPARTHRPAPSSSTTIAAAVGHSLRLGVGVRIARRPTAAAMASAVADNAESSITESRTGACVGTR